MVKPNVSYVKETNEVHYNPRFVTDFEPGNYYVDEANYLAYAYNDIKNTCFKDYTLDNSPSFYIEGNKCGTVVNRVTVYDDISDKPYYRYLYTLSMNNYRYSENYYYLTLSNGRVRLYIKDGGYAELYFSDGSYDYRDE